MDGSQDDTVRPTEEIPENVDAGGENLVAEDAGVVRLAANSVYYDALEQPASAEAPLIPTESLQPVQEEIVVVEGPEETQVVPEDVGEEIIEAEEEEIETGLDKNEARVEEVEARVEENDARVEELEPQEEFDSSDSPVKRKSSAVVIQFDPVSPRPFVRVSPSKEIQPILEEARSTTTSMSEEQEKSPRKPNYQIKEFVESASKLRFGIKNTSTTFNIMLPTLKNVVEVPEWEKATLRCEIPEVAQAMRAARARTRRYLSEMARCDYRMVVSEVRHLTNYELARNAKSRLLQQGRGCVRELTEPPQRCDPARKHGQRKRPTEYPPMPNLDVDKRPREGVDGARLRCARSRYNQRSDDTWLRTEQHKLIRAAERQLSSSKLNNGRLATPPQQHDPWAPPQRVAKPRPNITLPQHRH